jgi:chromosomal replication initiator protein
MMQPGDTAVAVSGAREDEILREFERRVGSRTFNLWVRDNASIEIAQDQVTLNIHNKFLLSWLQQRYRSDIVAAVRTVLGNEAEVQFHELTVAAAVAAPIPTPHVAADIPCEARTRPIDRPHSSAHRNDSSWRAAESRGPSASAGESRGPSPSTGLSPCSKGLFVDPSPLAAISTAKLAVARAQHQNPRSTQDRGSICREQKPSGEEASRATAAAPAGSASKSAPSQSPLSNGPSTTNPVPPSSKRRFADLTDFVTGPGNQLAFTAALQICEQPGGYNPLVLHGGVGIGKTHLLEGVYRRMRIRYPSFRVMFLSAESFANYFTQALRDRTLASFRQRFRGVDVLMIDDVDFLDGKRVIQEEFLHTIKQLESHGRQVALTADRHPRLLTRLSEELVTRFMSGIVCRIESPDVDTRRAIVARKAARLTARVTDEAIEFVVQRFPQSVRELEGALNFLETYGLMTGKTITHSIARNVLADLERDCVRIVRVAEVEQAVCRLFSIGPNDLRSPRRTRTVSQPRMLAMYLARKMTQAAYTEIGEHFGGRNHSTVMSAEKRVRSLLEANATVKAGNQDWKLGDLLASLEQQLLTG